MGRWRWGLRWGMVVMGLLAFSVLGGCRGRPAHAPGRRPAGLLPDPLADIPDPRTPAEKIVNGAKAEARRGVRLDQSYARVAYPGGDVPHDRGACTDVIVRALRCAGYDIQRLIHEDMQAHWDRYPHIYGRRAPDPNIDHRRVPNQMAFMRRHALSLPLGTKGPDAATWQPGDLIYMRHGAAGHCGVISNVRGRSGLPMVIHNASITRQVDVLGRWDGIAGHFRFPPPRREYRG